MTITARRFDAVCYLLLDKTGTIVGFAHACANGAWVPADSNGNRIGPEMSFRTPAAVARWWAETQKAPPP